MIIDSQMILLFNRYPYSLRLLLIPFLITRTVATLRICPFGCDERHEKMLTMISDILNL
jgi:hypothetical protein